MTKKIEVFASEALPGELEEFPDIKRGWGTTKELTGGIPPMKWFNAIQKRTDESINAISDTSVGGYTFKNGATLESENDFIYDDINKSWYFWVGDTPKVINENSIAGEVISGDGGLYPMGDWVPLSSSATGGNLSIANSKDFKTLKEWAESDFDHKILSSGTYIVSDTLKVRCKTLTTDGKVTVKMKKQVPFIYIGSDEIKEVIPSTDFEIKGGDGSIPLPPDSSVSAGDTLFIYNPVDFSFSPHRYYYRQGEAVYVSGVQGDEAILSGAVIDDYPKGCKLLKPSFLKVSISGQYEVEYEKITNGDHTYSPNAVGFLVEQVIDSCFDGLNITAIQASQAFILRRSVNCFGSGIHNTQIIDGKSILGLDSGLGIANCHGVYFSGVFSGERHGCSISGTGAIGGIVTRFCSIGGEILSTGRDSKLSADWHGNVEYCNYYGRIQGVTAGGNHNSILPGSYVWSNSHPNSINEKEPTIGFREINGLDFNFSGITIESNCKPSLAYKGVVDLGSTASRLNKDVKEGGILNFSNSKFKSVNSEHIFKLRSDNFDKYWCLDLTNSIIERAGRRPIWVQPSAGVATNDLKLSGLKILSEESSEIIAHAKDGSVFGLSTFGRVKFNPSIGKSASFKVSMRETIPDGYIIIGDVSNNDGTYKVTFSEVNQTSFNVTIIRDGNDFDGGDIFVNYVIHR